jgi:lipopolysaccharide biosynthesis glycosyltransferase
MNSHPIQLVTGGDIRFLAGIQVTVGSALIGISQNRSVVVHILDGGLTNDTRKNLRELARHCHRGAELVFHMVTEASLETFVPGPGNSRMYYARIGMASLMTTVERVIYLDSDTLILGDLSQVWETESAGAIVMACKDRKVCKLSEDSPWPLIPEDENLPYFNSGVMLVDLAQWRKEGIEQQCLDLIAKPAGPYRWWDQTILNHVLRGKVEFLPGEWNWQSGEIPASSDPSPRVLHYTTGLKPWLYWGGAFRFKAWRKCYQLCIGSPLRLFLKNDSWQGLIHGIFDELLDNSQIIRSLYLSYLKLALKFSRSHARVRLIGQKIQFLTSPRKSPDQPREKQLLKEFQQKVQLRMQSH